MPLALHLPRRLLLPRHCPPPSTFATPQCHQHHGSQGQGQRLEDRRSTRLLSPPPPPFRRKMALFTVDYRAGPGRVWQPSQSRKKKRAREGGGRLAQGKGSRSRTARAGRHDIPSSLQGGNGKHQKKKRAAAAMREWAKYSRRGMYCNPPPFGSKARASPPGCPLFDNDDARCHGARLQTPPSISSSPLSRFPRRRRRRRASRKPRRRRRGRPIKLPEPPKSHGRPVALPHEHTHTHVRTHSPPSLRCPAADGPTGHRHRHMRTPPARRTTRGRLGRGPPSLSRARARARALRPANVLAPACCAVTLRIHWPSTRQGG